MTIIIINNNLFIYYSRLLLDIPGYFIIIVTKQPGQLDKGIANDLIKGVAAFNNPIYKDNFVRIIRFLQAQ